MRDRLTIAGVSAVALGLMLAFGQMFGGGSVASVLAGGSFTPVADPTVNTATSVAATCVPGQTCPNTATSTPVKFRTHTPTATVTPGVTQPTSTPEPANTAAPAATSPAPGSGNEGVAVRPPNTGSGDGAAAGSTDVAAWVIGAGLLLIILGSGAALAGVRQRR